MKKIFALLLSCCGYLSASSQDSLSAFKSYFGNYQSSNGRLFSVGRTDNNLFLMDYGQSACRYLSPAGKQTFTVGKTGDKIMLQDDHTLLFISGQRKDTAWKVKPADTEDMLVKADGATLGGTLWKPRGKNTFPVIILVHGAGYETRHNMRYLPYLFNAWGYGVFTYDKRGCGVSTGSYQPWDAGIRVLAGDVEHIYHHLETRKEISAISMMGISNGAWVVSDAASRLPHTAFIIPVVGGFVPVYKQELYRIHEAGKKAALTPQDVAEMDSVMASIYNDQFFQQPPAVAIPKLQQLMSFSASRPWFSSMPLKDFQQVPTETLFTMGKAAWENELSYKPEKYPACEIYALLGEADKISPASQIAGVVNTLPKASATVIPHATHFMVEEGTDIIPELYLKTLKKILKEKKPL
ncbi:alpha/beta hydrolase [Chitinophaga sp. Mgbs1]|uniref:Alpha/beta hydrolase n=1 Tax=Chitinophaga solisilvae TaxID=1233460 RepID=A0A3S1B068_9BACT|nr:alpha/beta hydrolase [Chitinophaga solisilvae]